MSCPEDYGTCDTPTNTLAAINAALAANREVTLCDRDYTVDGSIFLGTRQAITGRGAGQTKLSTTAAAPIITIGGSLCRVEGMTLSGGTVGVSIPAYSDQTCLRDLWIYGAATGLALSSCDTGYIESVKVLSSTLDGIAINPVSTYPVAQWKLDRILVSVNGRDGIRVIAPSSGGNVALGTWMNIETYANGAYGLDLVGNAASRIYGFRLSDSFLGADGTACIRLDTYGGMHRLADTIIELSPGYGILGTANNSDLAVSNCLITGNGADGINYVGTTLQLTGNRIVENGQGGVVKRGVVCGALIATGNRIGSSSQSYGIAATVDNATLVGNDLRGNSVGGFTGLASGSAIYANRI